MSTASCIANKKVLLVDADPDSLAQMRQPLEAAGCRVSLAETAVEAEKWLEENWPDLAIVGLMLEYKDSGFGLCYRIKKKNPKTPVIMVTGVTRETGLEFDAATAEERAWIKADVLLDKPVRVEQLANEVGSLLKN